MSPTDHPEKEDAGVRLSKRVAEQMDCSRREAELYIEYGSVQVDGVTVETLGARVLPHQTVTLNTTAKPQEVPPVTILLHKPAGFSISARPGSPKNALDLLRPANRAEVDTPGPLLVLQKHFQNLECMLTIPVPASGLMVFTQDPRMIHKLKTDALHIEQECVVEVRGTIDPGGLERLCDGTAVAGKRLPRAKVSWQNEKHLRFALKGIFPDEIAEMCECVGLQVVSLKRLRVGRISMGKLPEGQWRYTMPWEKF